MRCLEDSAFGEPGHFIGLLFKEQAFDPQTVKVLTTAFECSHAQLDRSDRSDPLIAEFVAKLIIDFASQGERDPVRLSELVLECLKE